MSILYDYLKVLEKKKREGVVSLEAPVKKNNIALMLNSLVASFILLGCVLALFLLKSTMATQQSIKFPSINSNMPALNKDDVVLEQGYSLKGIIYNPDSPSAIINGKLVGKNTRIGDWQVVEISPSEVKLENASNESLLTLKLNSTLEQ